MVKTLSIVMFAIIFGFSVNGQNFKLRPLFTAITVSNIDSSISWYTKVLNLKIRNRIDNDARGFKQAILIDSEIMVELVELKKAISADTLLKTQTSGTQVLGYYKFGFTVHQIDSLFQQYFKMSLNFLGKMVIDPVNKKKTFIIMDPDGNLVQFFEE